MTHRIRDTAATTAAFGAHVPIEAAQTTHTQPVKPSRFTSRVAFSDPEDWSFKAEMPMMRNTMHTSCNNTPEQQTGQHNIGLFIWRDERNDSNKIMGSDSVVQKRLFNSCLQEFSEIASGDRFLISKTEQGDCITASKGNMNYILNCRHF